MEERISMSSKDLKRLEVLTDIENRRLKQAKGARILEISTRQLWENSFSSMVPSMTGLKGARCTLLVFIDDATSETLHLKKSVRKLLTEYVIFCRLIQAVKNSFGTFFSLKEISTTLKSLAFYLKSGMSYGKSIFSIFPIFSTLFIN